VLWSADIRLSAGVNEIVRYFASNIGIVIACVVSLVGFLWFFRMFLYSLGVGGSRQAAKAMCADDVGDEYLSTDDDGAYHYWDSRADGEYTISKSGKIRSV